MLHEWTWPWPPCPLFSLSYLADRVDIYTLQRFGMFPVALIRVGDFNRQGTWQP